MQPVTPALIVTWLSETGQLSPDDEKPVWRDLTTEQKVVFLDWLELHNPDQAEQG